MKDSVVQDHYIHNILTRRRVTDELHIGARVATEYLLAAMDLKPGMKVLDVGSGLGAAARLAASLYNIHVTGIDLVPEFCEEARRNADDGRVEFICGSALDMDFESGMFDAAFMLHVNMNIREKKSLINEIARVIKKNSQFGFYEILAGEHVAAMAYPCPWAANREDSFLIAPVDLDNLLAEAGFATEKKEGRRDFGIAAMERRQADYPEQPFVNLLENVRENRCAPWQYICRKI
ncbi:MAG: class I SAM-dependent methyltransferase [Micavibrio aeruginosavorus]|uniref:Class I SAM-dependent methyltransferase n=1 Tax=Micavibrio aeruginosavorus TaxID=349221 RepID=A0A7T5R4A5_9BACT|nr:MAG: class I SAM-dependent methyltransferase [Micavibrio aeruginosavorus]